MNALMWMHIAGGSTAILAGALAVAVGKGGRLHANAGSVFAASMLVLGGTAFLLAQAKDDPGLGLGGLLACYFVATSWAAARRRDGVTGRFETVACVLVLAPGAAIAWSGATGRSTTPVGPGPLFGFAGICLVAGLLDLRAVVQGRLTPVQRLTRHLWRMCFGFFMATGSFFLGQQDVMPEAVRGSPILFVLAFAPFAAMLYWLVRLRFAKAVGRLALRAPAAAMPVAPSN